jgi:hypothetical protein
VAEWCDVIGQIVSDILAGDPQVADSGRPGRGIVPVVDALVDEAGSHGTLGLFLRMAERISAQSPRGGAHHEPTAGCGSLKMDSTRNRGGCLARQLRPRELRQTRVARLGESRPYEPCRPSVSSCYSCSHLRWFVSLAPWNPFLRTESTKAGAGGIGSMRRSIRN